MGKKVWVKHRKYLTPKYARPYCLAHYWLEFLRICLSRNFKNWLIIHFSRIREFENSRSLIPKTLGKYWRDILNLETRNVAFWIYWDFEISHLEISLDILLQSHLHTDQKKEAPNSNVTRWDFVKLYLCAELLATQRPFSSNLASLFLARHSEKKIAFVCTWYV